MADRVGSNQAKRLPMGANKLPLRGLSQKGISNIENNIRDNILNQNSRGAAKFQMNSSQKISYNGWKKEEMVIKKNSTRPTSGS